jgi:enoyl-CoA hydratase
MNLALACDVRIAGRSARFVSRFLDLGLHPGSGHTFMLQRVGGPQLAAAMVLFGERLDGETAAEHGLAWRCVEDDRLLEEAVSFAMRAASAPRALALRAKDTLRRVGALHEHSEAVDLEIAAQMWSLGEPFFAERLAVLRARLVGQP